MAARALLPLALLCLVVPITASVASPASLQECKKSFGAAVQAADETSAGARCEALARLAECLGARLPAASVHERMSAQGFFDAAKLTTACTNVAGLPAAVLPADDAVEAAALRQRRDTASVSIWDIGQKFDALAASSVDKAAFEQVQKSVVALQETTVESLSKVREDILLVVEARMGTLANTVTTAMRSTLAALQSTTTTMNTNTIAQLAALETRLKGIGAVVTQQVLSQIAGKTDQVKATITTATNLAASVDGRIAALEPQVATRTVAAINSTKTGVDKLLSTLSKSVYFDASIPVFRYAFWSTFSQGNTWYCDNNGLYFGGVAPQTWTDGNGYASGMSADKNVLRALFNKKMTTGWNAHVKADEWYHTSSTNGKLTGALFRIRNTTPSTITWTPYYYYSSYGGWSEAASVALNGVNQWSTTGTCGYCTASVALTMPANRISTVIVTSSSGYPSTMRSNVLVFYNDCLKLPVGLEYVDDLDTATGDFNS